MHVEADLQVRLQAHLKGPSMPIVYAGTLPMTAAIVIRFALLDNPFYWAMAAMREL